MATTYNYSLSSDFGGNINIKQLHKAIDDDVGIGQNLSGIGRNDDDIDITFDNALNAGEQTVLNILISNFTADPKIWNMFQFETITFLDSPYDIGKKSLRCNTAGGNITVKLDSADDNKDVFYGIRKVSALNTVTIQPDGSDLIDGQATKTLTANNETIIIYSDGTEWIIGTGDEGASLTEIRALATVTKKGDLIVDDGTVQTNLKVGSDNEVLIADSTKNEGIKWAQLDHTTLSNIGSNTHAQIDTHISSSSGHGVSGDIVGTSDSQTLTNKTINTTSNTLTVATGDVTSGTFADARIAESNVTQHEGSITIGNLVGAPTGQVVGISDTQTLTNKTFTDNTTYFQDNSNNSKKLQFQLSGISASTTRTLTVPDANTTIVGTDATQTLTNKTINTASNTLTIATADVSSGTFADARIAESNVTQHEGAITIGNLSGAPSGTVVGTSDTQTLTNKTLTSPKINDTSANHQYIFGVNELTANRTVTLPLLTGNDTFVFEDFSQTLTNKTINTGSNTIILATSDITSGTFADARIAASNITQHEGSITIGNLSGAPTGTVVGTSDSQTLTNKTLTTPIISSISNTGTLTLPTSTDTLIGKATTDTLTNKTWGDNLDMNSNKIINIATPTADGDVASKGYVDSVATGLDIKDSVVTASTVDLDSNGSISGSITYNATAGASSRGQITATLVTSDTFTIDGVNFGSAQNGSRILLKDQSTGAQNGIWTTTVSGTSLTLDRATDFDADAEVTSGAFMFVEQGTVNDNSGWTLTTDDPITIGGGSGTSLTFAQFSGAGQITAGTGMTKSGNTLDIGGSTTIISNADDLEVNSSNTANQILLSSGTVGVAATFGQLPLGNSNAVTGTLTVSNGGTGVTTHTSNAILKGNGTSAIASSGVTIDGSNNLTTNGDIKVNATDKYLTTTGTSSDLQIGFDTSVGTFVIKQDGAGGAIRWFPNADNPQFLFGKTDMTGSGFIDVENGKTLKLQTLETGDIMIGNGGMVPETSGTPDIGGAGNLFNNIHANYFHGDGSNLTSVANAAIASAAAIDAIKIADGTVSNTEFQRINALGSLAVGISDTQTLTNKTIDTTNNTLTIATDDISSGTFADARIAASNITQHEGSINHDNLLGFVANEHLDWTSDQGASNIHQNNIIAAAITQHEGSITIGNLSGAPTGSVLGTTDTQTLTNKTLTDNTTYFQDNLDNTKKLQLQLSGITTATTRTLTIPNANTTIVGTDATQTLTNKTINTASNTITIATADVTSGTFADARIAASNVTQHEGSLTIGNLSGAPTGAVVGTSDTQTLTNKTINTASNTITIATGDVTSGTFANARIAASNVTQHEGSITIGNLIGAPTGAVVGISDTQTLTNKTINTASNTITISAADVTSGTLSVSRGGSGATTHTSDAILTGNGTGAITSSQWTINSNGVLNSAFSYAGYILDVHNIKADGGGNGFRIKAGELLGDIAFHVADQDDTFQIMELEADQGYMTLGKTYAQTLSDNGIVYGIDNQHPYDVSLKTSDFNTQSGLYRVGGNPLALNHLDDIVLTSPASGDHMIYNGTNWVNDSGSSGAVQARRSTIYTLTTGYVDITLNNTDIETDSTIIEHDNTNTDRIVFKEAGTYIVAYDIELDANNTDGQTAYGEARIRLNDTTEINGSYARATAFQDASIGNNLFHNHISNLFQVTVNANDYITLQLKYSGNGTTDVNSLTIKTWTMGTNGPQGSQGPTGSGSNVTVKDEGTNVTNTPHSALNFVGSNVTVTDGGSGTATVTISGSTSKCDRQQVYQTSQISTTSATYTDMTSMTLTTKNLGETGTYVINFEASMANSSRGADADVRILVGGVEKKVTQWSVGRDQTSSADHVSVKASCITSGISNGTIIKVQWNDGGGTAYAADRMLWIDGVPDSYVVA